MEMCNHVNTKVLNSRPNGALNSNGLPWFKVPDYPCLVIRRRKCLSCGERFTTAEVDKDYIDALAGSVNVNKLRDAVIKEMQLYLEGQRARDTNTAVNKE